MITYKNISFSAKTFYGVKFEPGEIKEVPGYINCQYMVRVYKPVPVTTVIDVPVEPEPETPTVQETVIPVSTRGRKKKSSEPEKVSVAETEEIINLSEEETLNGNPS